MPDKIVIYKEVISQDRIYYLVMGGVILLLIALTLVFIVTDLLEGAIPTGATAIFLVFITATTKRAVLTVTDEKFIMKFWVFTFKTSLADIESVEIKDVSLLPGPCRGHVKVGGRCVKFFNGLRVLRLRDGDAVHIRTKQGKTIITTPQNNQGLAEALIKQRGYYEKIVT